MNHKNRGQRRHKLNLSRILESKPNMEFIERLQTDGTVRFFLHVQACVVELGAKSVLDFGAGRGAGIHQATQSGSRLKSWVQDLGAQGAQVTVCDIDDTVLEHPRAHSRVIIPIDGALPFPSESFDVIVSDNTFEHISEPARVARELLRILRPGGVICARTPSKYGYVALISAAIPSRNHAKLLKHVQPNRKEQDVFPTCYLLNTDRDVKRHFPGCVVKTLYTSGEPSYYFGSQAVRSAFTVLHRILLGPINTTAWFFIQKPQTFNSQQHESTAVN